MLTCECCHSFRHAFGFWRLNPNILHWLEQSGDLGMSVAASRWTNLQIVVKSRTLRFRVANNNETLKRVGCGFAGAFFDKKKARGQSLALRLRERRSYPLGKERFPNGDSKL